MILRQAAVLGLIGAIGGLLIAGVARPLIAGMIGDVQLSPFVIGAHHDRIDRGCAVSPHGSRRGERPRSSRPLALKEQ